MLYFYTMEVTDKLVEHLANLSKVHFTPTEKAALQTDLQNMIGFVEQLQQVDTTHVQPLLHMCEPLPILRADELAASLTQELATANAALAKNPFFAVPKV
ncbi:MAG: Asp-tRNA(Asn)/Glu-tRNA(Gln) amidotransferase GatCAB subunit C, partial [Bacteroidetes bacterium]